MPELPEVETLRRSLEQHLGDDAFARVRVHSAALREPLSQRQLARRLTGHRIEGLRRRGKYLLIDVAGDSTLVVHLGMSGSLTLESRDLPRRSHEHVSFDLASGRQLRFRDPRRFGLVFAAETSRLARDRHFAHLGIEPLGGLFTGGYLETAASGRRCPIKSLLMDASVVVGVGNIYACEALFRSGIRPSRPVDRIAAPRFEALAVQTIAVLEDAIAQGGTTLNDFQNAVGEPGYFQVELAVYGRKGEPCLRCARPLARRVQANRSTFYCPGCQR